jgi:hypothetical protein
MAALAWVAGLGFRRRQASKQAGWLHMLLAESEACAACAHSVWILDCILTAFDWQSLISGKKSRELRLKNNWEYWRKRHHSNNQPSLIAQSSTINKAACSEASTAVFLPLRQREPGARSQWTGVPLLVFAQP